MKRRTSPFLTVMTGSQSIDLPNAPLFAFVFEAPITTYDPSSSTKKVTSFKAVKQLHLGIINAESLASARATVNDLYNVQTVAPLVVKHYAKQLQNPKTPAHFIVDASTTEKRIVLPFMPPNFATYLLKTGLSSENPYRFNRKKRTITLRPVP